MKLKTKAISAAIFLCLAPLAKGLAGPPFITDDPEPVEYKHWELYLAATHERTKFERTASLPQVEINYGLLPDLQVHIIASAVFVHTKDAASAYGYGDTEIGAKYRFIHETQYMPQVAFFPRVELPSGNAKEGLGNGKTQVLFPLWLQKSFGPWTTYGGGGYWHNPGAGNKNWNFIGWVLQRDISKMLILGIEFFYQTPDKVGVSDSNGFNVGTVINLDEHNHLLCSMGRDFRGQNRFMGYAAYQLKF